VQGKRRQSKQWRSQGVKTVAIAGSQNSGPATGGREQSPRAGQREPLMLGVGLIATKGEEQGLLGPAPLSCRGAVLDHLQGRV